MWVASVTQTPYKLRPDRRDWAAISRSAPQRLRGKNLLDPEKKCRSSALGALRGETLPDHAQKKTAGRIADRSAL